ncbi:MAG: Uma2 family endonuclease [Planctomycetes bacterium]|nr:Uma2 family endonuclease [Planctomycetota bacterium]
MKIAVQLGPGDHGRPLTLEEFLAGDYEGGWDYELIHGRLYVSPAPNQPHDWVTNSAYRRLDDYSRLRPDVINHVTPRARVFVPGEPDTTAPEPDIAAYRDFPHHLQPHVSWQDVSPLVAVETLAEDGPSAVKDLERNVELFRRVPTIQEYWVFDIREDPSRPTLIVHRRVGDDWEVTTYGPDDVYTTDLLPGFELPVAPTIDR